MSEQDAIAGHYDALRAEPERPDCATCGGSGGGEGARSCPSCRGSGRGDGGLRSEAACWLGQPAWMNEEGVE